MDKASTGYVWVAGPSDLGSLYKAVLPVPQKLHLGVLQAKYDKTPGSIQFEDHKTTVRVQIKQTFELLRTEKMLLTLGYSATANDQFVKRTDLPSGTLDSEGRIIVTELDKIFAQECEGFEIELFTPNPEYAKEQAEQHGPGYQRKHAKFVGNGLCFYTHDGKLTTAKGHYTNFQPMGRGEGFETIDKPRGGSGDTDFQEKLKILAPEHQGLLSGVEWSCNLDAEPAIDEIVEKLIPQIKTQAQRR